MALTSYNDNRETHRKAYDSWFEVRYSIRRNIHFYIVALMLVVLLAPAAWYLWLPLMGFLYVVDTDRKVRMQDPFGRGKGPYMKKKAGTKSGIIEEWSVISTPQHRGGDGIWPLGNNIYTNEEIWASDDFVRTHAVLSGTTGSGKTVTMSSTFIYVAMISDSGVIMIDGKADPKTWFELYAMAVAAGRTDDFLVLNFVVGQTQEAEFSLSSAAEKELWEEFQAIESNTFNIFGTGTSDTLFEIGSALLGADATGDNKMWVERAEALLRSLLKALVDLRDQGQLKISIATLQEYMSLEKLSELENNEDISEIARQQVGAVLNEIAGYRDAVKVEDPQKRAALLADQPSKQFAFLHMQFGALYAMLIGTYGHIANVEYSDIWAPDVIRNRRILLVMLPALEKAPTSLAQLGRMATSAIKSALAQNISGSLTGRKSELVDRRPTNSTRAMVLIYDEAASYIQAGTADVASQSRSLGAFNIFSSQEWGSFKQAGDIEAQRIISNTGLKIVLKNEDKDTADQFMAAVGEAPILKSGGKRHENGKLVENEQRLENVPRVTFQEMMNLAEGQAYIKWRDTLIHARMPFVPHPKIEGAQRNDLVPIPGSMANDRVKMRLSFERADDILHSHVPPLDLTQGLVTLLEREEDQDLKPQYALLEKIVRSSYQHQVVIPWKEAPPPRGKVKATEMFTFAPEQISTTLMWVMERSKDHPMIKRLVDLHEKPDERFAMPFMPHEAGLIDGGQEEDIELAEAREKIDELSAGADEISSLLENKEQDSPIADDSVPEADATDENATQHASENTADTDGATETAETDIHVEDESDGDTDLDLDDIEASNDTEDPYSALDGDEAIDDSAPADDNPNEAAVGSGGGFAAFLSSSPSSEPHDAPEDSDSSAAHEVPLQDSASHDIMGALLKEGMAPTDRSSDDPETTPTSEEAVSDDDHTCSTEDSSDTTAAVSIFKSLMQQESENHAYEPQPTDDSNTTVEAPAIELDDGDSLPFDGIEEVDVDEDDTATYDVDDVIDDETAAEAEIEQQEEVELDQYTDKMPSPAVSVLTNRHRDLRVTQRGTFNVHDFDNEDSDEET